MCRESRWCRPFTIARTSSRSSSCRACYAISEWTVGWCRLRCRVTDGRAVPVQAVPLLREWTDRLADAAEKAHIRFRVIDEFGAMRLPREGRAPERVKRLVDPDVLYRLEPSGHVRLGREALEVWDPARARRWNPRSDHVVDVLGPSPMGAR